MRRKQYFRFVFAVILLSYLSVSVFADAPVPASETVVIKGELNDSFENASFFDHETAYTFGKTHDILVVISDRPEVKGRIITAYPIG